MKPYFKSKELEIPENVRVSCGFPSTRALSEKGKRLGECWEGKASVDGVSQIFITPLLSDNLQVLEVLTHELLHACLPEGTGHKKGFKVAAEKVGFEPNSIGRISTPELVNLLNTLLLEPYPQVKLIPPTVEKKQGIRLQKLVCKSLEHEEPVIIRATKKVTDLGLPSCFCGMEFFIEEKEKDN